MPAQQIHADTAVWITGVDGTALEAPSPNPENIRAKVNNLEVFL
jgi:hypothetical protein